MHRRPLILALAAAGLGARSPASRAATAVSAGAGPELLFGQSAVLSGPLGQPVLQFNAGARLAFDEFNAAGGLHGRRLRLLSLDDGLSPERALANVHALLREHKVFGLFGCTGSATTAAMEPLLRDTGVPAFGGYAVADSVRLRSRGVAYFVRASYGREAATLVRHLTTIGVARIGVAHLANPGGEEVLRLLGAALAEHRLEPAVSAAVALDGSNVTEAARKLAALQPQAVVMFLGGQLAADLMNQMGQRRLHTAFYGMSISGGELAAAKLGQRARGLTLAQIVPSPDSAVDPAILAYRRLAETAQVSNDHFSLEGYLTARVLIEALRRGPQEPSRARLHATLRGLQMRIAGLDLDFTLDGHTGSRYVDLVQLSEDGRFIR
ncbi:MAG: hypothetical protein RJA44_916 [Pseudomonadota bacterium]|jgi:ABC-type branched-subunit amino acid transport system substrate-binding protein